MTQKIELSAVSDYELEIEKVYEQLERLQGEVRIVSDGEGLEELEQEIRRLTDRLGSLLLGAKIQGALDSAEGEAAEKELVKGIPKRLKSEGKKGVHLAVCRRRSGKKKRNDVNSTGEGLNKKQARRGAKDGTEIQTG